METLDLKGSESLVNKDMSENFIEYQLKVDEGIAKAITKQTPFTKGH